MSHYIKKHIRISLVLAVLTILTGSASGQILSPGLEEKTAKAELNGSAASVSVVVFLEQGKEAQMTAALAGKNRHERIGTLLRQLPGRRGINEETVESFLKENSVSEISRMWIVPSYRAELPIEKVTELSFIPGVRLIVENAPLHFDKPVETLATGSESVGISEQLNLLKVPALWQRGLKGAGRLVCSFDTGVEQSHPALAAKWRGNFSDLSAAWFSKVKPDTLPYDRAAHGTHTMGVMVGAMEADSFGVAPEAEWITAGVIDQGRPLQTTFADIIEAFQWTLNPDGDPTTSHDVPDVILNSWGVPKGMFTPCDETFRTVIETVEAAGIVTIFAAGNEGPDPSTLRSPADFAGTPLSSFAVGAVDNNRNITNFSSRGPSSCDANEKKPEVVAFGYQIRSSQKGGGFALMSGTSMAAPYIAGLVALMRQYNPEATVEQIKNALILSASDLGPAGEDNSYGHGLVDASSLLEHLPTPSVPDFALASVTVLGDGQVVPGSTTNVEVSLASLSGGLSQVVGRITTDDPNATIINDESLFDFGPGGVLASGLTPFTVSFDTSLIHGTDIEFGLVIESAGSEPLDSLQFEIRVGFESPGSMATLSTTSMRMTISDFGQMGLGAGSIYNAGGEGFRYEGSENLLYESGVIIGRNALQLSSSVRDSSGQFAVSDFTPTEPLDIVSTGNLDQFAARFEDSFSEIPIPVAVTQKVSTYESEGDFMIFEFKLENVDLQRVTSINFAYFADFDLAAEGESFVYNADLDLLYQMSSSGEMIGLVGLKNIAAFVTATNESGKTGYTRSQLFSMITTSENQIDFGGPQDRMFMACSQPFDIDPLESRDIAFALVAGMTEAEILDNAVAARQRWDLITDVDDTHVLALPESAELHQNYPNPFNPQTTIGFSLESRQDVSLNVYDVTGRKVRTLVNQEMEAGNHSVIWNGESNSGDRVASGVYFYRLETTQSSHTRKMVLLK